MASPFQRYQGEQVQQIPAGYLEAMGQGARSIGAGFASFGDSVAKGIEKYSQNKMLGEAADEKLQGAIQHFGMMADAYRNHPEFGQLAQTYAKAQEDAAKALTGSLGKKQGALGRLELIDKSAQQFVAATTAKNQAIALAAYDETPETKRVIANETLLQYGYRPGDTNSLNRAIGYAAQKMQQANEVSGFKPGDEGYNDVVAGINSLLGNAKTGIADALKADPKNLQLLNAEKELSGAISQFSAAYGAQAALQAGAKDISKYAGMAVEGTAQREAASAAMRPATNIPEREDAARARLKEAETNLQSTTERLSSGEFVSQPVAETVVSGVKAVGNLINNQYAMRSLARGLKEFEALKGNGIEITPEVARELVRANNDFAQSLSGVSLLAGNIRAVVDMINPFESLTEKEKRNITMAMQEASGGRGVQPVEASGFGLKGELETNKKAYEMQVQQAKDEIAKIEKEKAAATGKTVQLTATGNVARETPLTGDQRVAMAKEALAKSDYVRTRFGGKIPTSALQALQSKLVAPPAMITDPATGARLYQSAPGKWEQLKVDEGKDGASRVNMPLFRPEHESIKAGTQPQYQVSGVFKGSEKEKSEFIATTQKRARALTSIDRLIEINENTGEALKPSLIGEAETIVNEIIASNRVDLIGPGQVAVAEWQMLAKLVRDPTKLVELDSVTLANLRRLKQRMENVMDDEAYAKGVMLTRQTSGAEVGRTMRVQRLLNRPEQ